MPCGDGEVIGRLMPKFLYFKYMPYGQTYDYAQIFILQICHMGRLMPKFQGWQKSRLFILKSTFFI